MFFFQKLNYFRHFAPSLFYTFLIMHVVDIKGRNNNNNRHIFPCEKRLITLIFAGMEKTLIKLLTKIVITEKKISFVNYFKSFGIKNWFRALNKNLTQLKILNSIYILSLLIILFNILLR